jgi:serine phosphatase RsbU (regulator of sigma subunit)
VLEVIQYPEYFLALGKNPLIVATDARNDPRTREFRESYLEPLGITSLMDVPIRLRGETSGIICHEHVGPARNWLPEEQSFAASLAELASLAMEAFERNRAEMALRVSEEKLRQRNEMIERDLKNAQIIQKALLPSHIPKTSYLKIDYRIFYMDAVGGDYFSFTDLREGGLGIFIGDVSGHGVSAALFLSLLKSTADRICRKMGRTPSEFIRKLNVDLIDSMQQYFVTAIYGIFNDSRGDGIVTFTFAKGGHPEPILYRAATGEASLVKSSGTILSKFANAQYQETTIDLRKGDRLFLYTDGIPETRNAAGQIIGFNELPGILKGVMKPGLGETLDAVLAEVNRFRGDTTIDDDIVLIGFEAQ